MNDKEKNSKRENGKKDSGNGIKAHKTTPEKRLITKTTLIKDYGLNDEWLKLLGEPDKEVPNPYYSKASMYLYDEERVLAILSKNKEAYKRRLADRKKRSLIGTRVAEARAKKTLEEAEQAEVELCELSKDVSLLGMAASYFDDPFVKGAGIWAMLRHRFSNYDELLGDLHGKVGRNEAYHVVKEKVLCAMVEELKKKGIELPALPLDHPLRDYLPDDYPIE